MTAVERAREQCAHINKDRETIKRYEKYINRRVKLWGSAVGNKIVFGTYIAKHFDISMHYILIDGEEKAKPFHTFNMEFITKQQEQ
jgi:hypothetical protein